MSCGIHKQLETQEIVILFLVKTNQFTEEHWNNLAAVLEVLGPLKDATELTSGDTYPLLNMVVPAFAALLDHLKQLSESTNSFAESDSKAEAATAAFMKLNHTTISLQNSVLSRQSWIRDLS